MEKDELSWFEFILENFKSGTATEIAIHIEKMAKQKKYKLKNRNVRATVFKILPERTPGRFKPDSIRKNIISETFYYDDETKVYHLKSDWYKKESEHYKQQYHKQLKITHKPFMPRKHSGEKISVETPKDKSKQHDEIMKKLYDYAWSNGYEAEQEKENIDFLMKTNDSSGNEKWIINEVKSYKNSIYTAVGQLQWYKYSLLKEYPTINKSNISMLNIVGNFDLESKFKGFLDELKINYIKIEKIKDFL